MPTSNTQKSPSSTAQGILSFIKPVLEGIVTLLPLIIMQFSNIYKNFKKLPQNILMLLYGFVVCFFGGTFPTLFAALQAAEHGGRRTIMLAIGDLVDEALVIIDESQKEEKFDKNRDIKSDSEQLSSIEFLRRTTKLVLRKMNPEKIDKAISAIYSVWLSVAAVLSIQFARTISMALSIEEFLQKPMQRFLPLLVDAIPLEYQKWVPVVFAWIRKAIALFIAWHVHSIITTFTSSLQGGLIMARALYAACLEHNVTIFGTLPQDHRDSILDEGLSYAFACVGLYFQFSLRFSLPFPLNLLLSPFTILDYYVRWSIS